jgi:hypothetical protein
MKILFTNGTLTERTGSELFIFNLAKKLAARGHQVAIYTQAVGKFADDVRSAGIPVVKAFHQAPFTPDVIHGQHYFPTLAAITAFPTTPAIFVCHGAIPDPERPPRHERIRKYVGVDIPSRDRIVREVGVQAAEVEIIPNAVDMDVFVRRAPLPKKISKALVFTNSYLNSTILGAITDACIASGAQLSLAGTQFGTFTDHPEKILAGYDLIIAKARCALEALAVGAAVVLGDAQGMGPMVTAADVERMREYNFGFSLLKKPWTKEGLLREFMKYDPSDAAAVTDYIRYVAKLDAQVAKLESVYDSVVRG